APLVQTSFVHCLPSLGLSPLSTVFTMLPLASHCIEWQSPIVGSGTKVPIGALVGLHMPALQAQVRQAVLAPQSLAWLQPTQLPLPSHTSPVPHDVPIVTLVCEGVPLVHTSFVQ